LTGSGQGHDTATDKAKGVPSDGSPSVPVQLDGAKRRIRYSRLHCPLPIEDQQARQEESTEVVDSVKPADVDSLIPSPRPPAAGEDGQQLHSDSVDLRERTVKLPIRADPSDNDWTVAEEEWVIIQRSEPLISS